jgi:lysophospholipase L1-like esterase
MLNSRLAIEYIRCFFRRKGWFFLLNILIAVAGGYLMIPMFEHQSSIPLVFGYSAEYLLLLTVLAVSLTSYAVFICLSGASVNKQLFVLLIITFLLLEIVTRVALPGEFFHQKAYRTPRPYIVFSGGSNADMPGNPKMLVDGEEGASVYLNELGFRIERKITKIKQKSETRVFVLGGSTVFNGNPLANSVPGHLEYLFHKDGHTQVRVYNFGAVSYVSGQELALLVHVLIDYKPDLVIVYDGGNDIHQPYFYDPRPGYPYNYMVFEAGFDRVLGKGQGFRSRLSSSVYHSKVMKMLMRDSLIEGVVSLTDRRKECKYGSEGWEVEVVIRYVNNLKKMCAIAQAFGFKLMIFLQPTAHFKRPLMGYERSQLGNRDFQEYIKRQYARATKHYEDLQRQYTNDGRCTVVDMSHVMDGYEEEIYWDFIHTNNSGNRYIASHIYSHIQSKGI